MCHYSDERYLNWNKTYVMISATACLVEVKLSFKIKSSNLNKYVKFVIRPIVRLNAVK